MLPWVTWKRLGQAALVAELQFNCQPSAGIKFLLLHAGHCARPSPGSAPMPPERHSPMAMPNTQMRAASEM
jgi:hypothetical protein